MYIYLLIDGDQCLGSMTHRQSVDWQRVVFPILRQARKGGAVKLPPPSHATMRENGWVYLRRAVTAWGTLVVYGKLPDRVAVQPSLFDLAVSPPVLIGGENLDFGDTLSSSEVVGK